MNESPAKFTKPDMERLCAAKTKVYSNEKNMEIQDDLDSALHRMISNIILVFLNTPIKNLQQQSWIDMDFGLPLAEKSIPEKEKIKSAIKWLRELEQFAQIGGVRSKIPDDFISNIDKESARKLLSVIYFINNSDDRIGNETRRHIDELFQTLELEPRMSPEATTAMIQGDFPGQMAQTGKLWEANVRAQNALHQRQ
jgi:hypothetical protein